MLHQGESQEAGLLTLRRPKHTFACELPNRYQREKDQDSLVSLVSSMVISLNSLDSKMSPHSRHSTNSASSSRATICTRGCLHSGMSLLFSGSWGCGTEFINPGCSPVLADQG